MRGLIVSEPVAGYPFSSTDEQLLYAVSNVLITLWVSAAVSGSPGALQWGLSIIAGLVERIHINSRRVNAFYETIPAENSVLVKLQRLI
jgi:hypothetical protein